MAGVYALGGAFFAQRLLGSQAAKPYASDEYSLSPGIVQQLTWIAIAVLLLSLTTCVILTLRQSKNIKIPKGYAIHGIDVSYAQGQIDWHKVRAMRDKDVSITFAFIKATEGLLTCRSAARSARSAAFVP